MSQISFQKDLPKNFKLGWGGLSPHLCLLAIVLIVP